VEDGFRVYFPIPRKSQECRVFERCFFTKKKQKAAMTSFVVTFLAPSKTTKQTKLSTFD